MRGGLLTMVTNVVIGIAALVVVFLLVVLLGIQIQISTLTRRIDEVLDKLKKD